MDFKLPDEESAEKKAMVTLVVAIDEELLRRVEASDEIIHGRRAPCLHKQ